MITFYQHIEEIKAALKITDSGQIASLKRWYNQGANKIKKRLRRPVNKETIYTDLEEGEATYQVPEYVGRIFGAKYNASGNEQPLEEVTSQQKWDELTGFGGQSGVPTHYHLVGEDEIELWPKPHEDKTNGLLVHCSFKQARLVANDVSTGTAEVNDGDEVVTLSSSIVDASWVGRYFMVDDGHEEWYRISEYVSSTSFNLENNYSGAGGSGLSYIVGEIVDIPEEYLDLVELYVTARYNGLYRKNRAMEISMLAEFKNETRMIDRDYANPSKSRVVKSKRRRLETPNPLWRPTDGLS